MKRKIVRKKDEYCRLWLILGLVIFGIATYQMQTWAATHRHVLIKNAAVSASCEEAGNCVYWSCNTCGKYFSDSAGRTEIKKNSWVIPATGHSIKKTEAKAAGCVTKGNNAYWTCEICGKYFHYDVAGRLEEIEEGSWVTPTTGHKLKKTEAVNESCKTEGNLAYWKCKNCGKYFADSEGKIETKKNSWIIPKADWHQYANGICKICKKRDPNFTPNVKKSKVKKPKVKKTVTVILGKSIAFDDIMREGDYDGMSVRNAKKYKKYFRVHSNDGKITTKKYYKVKIAKTIPVKIRVDGKIHTVQVKIKIPAPKVRIKVKKYTSDGTTGHKFQFSYNIAGATKIKVRLAKGGTGRMNKELDRYISTAKSNRDSYILFSDRTLKKMKGKITFQVVAYYGKNKSEVCKETIKIK